MECMTLVLTCIVGFFAICHFLMRKSKNKFEELGILYQKPLPIFGNMAPVLFKRCSFAETLDRIYRLDENAKYFGFYDFDEPIIMIRSLDLIKDVTVKHFDHFVDHRAVVDVTREPLFGNNLFSLCGEKWKEVRNVLTPAFTSSKMKAMFKLMSVCATNFTDYLTEEATKEPYVMFSKDAFMKYTNDVLATCAFGISIDSMKNPNNEFYLLGRDLLNFEGTTSRKFFLLRSFPRMAKFFNIRIFDPKVVDFFEGIVRETVETRDREGITRPDMIQLMMESRDNKTDQSSAPLTVLDMTSQAFIFFLGGFDTTAILMCLVAHQIAVNPQMQKKLQDEIDEVFEETQGDPTYEAINKMQYLDAFINETLRYYPIAFFLDRVCVKSYNLPPAFPGAKTVTVQPGQTVWLPVYSLARDAKYFNEPDTFDPERFIEPKRNDIDPFTYLPFGIGPRVCIGNRFALLETKVMLCHLLCKCNLRPSPKTRLPLELGKGSFLMTAEGGFWLQLEPRDDVSRTVENPLGRVNGTTNSKSYRNNKNNM